VAKKAMIKTLNILFSARKDKPNTDGTIPLYCRITVNGQRTSFALQRNIAPDRWDATKGKVKGITEEAKSINAYLSLLSSRVCK
jgi:hypothetical protein